MRNLFTLALLVASVGVASMGTIGCGDGGSGGSGGGDGGSGADGGGGSGGGNGGGTTGTTGGTTGTTGGTTGTTGGTTGTTTGNLDCTGQLEQNDCGICIETNCCLELTACAEDTECFDCLSNPDADPTICGENAQIASINECAGTLCPDECGGGGAEPACDAPATSPSMGSCVTIAGGNECNPITNEGCTDPGAACDASEAGFTCYPADNVQALCDECGVSGSDYCMAGMTCVGKCARYCCEDTDCGTGKCTKGVFADAAVGFCEAI